MNGTQNIGRKKGGPEKNAHGKMMKMINKKSIIIFVVGIVLISLAPILKSSKKNVQWDGVQYSLDSVNKVDGALAHCYNRTLDKIGDAFVVLGNCLTFIVCILIPLIKSKKKNSSSKKVLLDAIVFSEIWIYTNALYRILKTMVGRVRPYMYFPNPSLTGILKGDFTRSWPSGHSASVFLAVGFLICWLNTNKIKASQKIVLISASVLIGIGTMTLRIFSGNHFFTDVISGSLLGLFVSFGIYFLSMRSFKNTALGEIKINS